MSQLRGGHLLIVLALSFACSALTGAEPHAGEPPVDAPPPETVEAPAEKTPDNTADDHPSKPESPPRDPRSIRLYLMDDSVITGLLSVADIEVETDFGKLTIPVDRIRSFRPGLASHPQLEKQVSELIDELGADQFDRREAAQRALLKLGPAVKEAVERHQDDTDNERRTRIKTILVEFDEQDEPGDEDDDAAARDQSVMIQRDTVETTEFTLVGRIVPKSFTVESPYGPLTVKLSDIRSGQRDVAQRETLRKSFAVDGAHMVFLGLKETNVRVERGDKVSILASGTLTMTPFGNRAFSTPDGAANFGWYVEGKIPGGALVARMGDSGPIFKVGSKHTFTAERAGTLHFGIALAGNHANQAFPGQYSVKVVVRRK